MDAREIAGDFGGVQIATGKQDHQFGRQVYPPTGWLDLADNGPFRGWSLRAARGRSKRTERKGNKQQGTEQVRVFPAPACFAKSAQTQILHARYPPRPKKVFHS